MSLVTCSLCGKTIKPNGKGTYRYIEGWERNRTSGEGVFPIKGRKYKFLFAHELCVDVKERSGETLQESLL